MEIKQSTDIMLQREELPPTFFRLPDPIDEADRIGQELARRLIEAGVVEP